MTAWVRGVRRRRSAVTLTAAALFGAPLIAGSAAVADSTDSVTFTGGCQVLGLGAAAQPDAERVSVPAGDGLRFVNDLGRPATLVLDGEPATKVPNGSSAEVVFHDGPVQATMGVDCLLDDPAGTVVVDVMEPADAPAAATPSGGGSSAGAGDRSGSAGSGGAGRSTGPTPSSSGGSSNGAGAAPGSQSPAQDGVPRGAAPGGHAPGGWAEGSGVPGGSAGAPGVGAPDAASGDREADEAGSDRDRGSRWEFDDSASGGDTPLNPANVDPQADDRLATEQVSQTTGSDDESIGLLALVATVCVVGVSAGAIRALIGRRATGT